MAKFYGIIGYAETVETKPGVWEEVVVKRPYYGDVVRNNRKLQTSEQLNDNINVNNQFSIVSDPYATQHFYSMKYIEYMGVKWKVTEVEVQYPRLILTVGGIYNGN